MTSKSSVNSDAKSNVYNPHEDSKSVTMNHLRHHLTYYDEEWEIDGKFQENDVLNFFEDEREGNEEGSFISIHKGVRNSIARRSHSYRSTGSIVLSY